MNWQKKDCEYLRYQAKQKFDKIRLTWCDLLQWALPHLSTWILNKNPGERKNYHIFDPTHGLALRSFVAGFLEGNTSASRPWYRIGTRDGSIDDAFDNRKWLQHYTERTLSYLASSNFYNAAGKFYYHYGVVNTGAHYFQEMDNGFFVHTLVPGSYYVLNDYYGVACVLVREFALSVKALVEHYGVKDKNGKADWSNISHNVQKMYREGNYTQMIDVVHVIKKNEYFDPTNPDDPNNRQWVELTYELGGPGGHFYSEGTEFGTMAISERDFNNTFLRKHTTKRKPFVVGKSTDEFEYGENGPTLMALGLIKSLNKKATLKDQALEQTVKPTLQGPANLRKSYLSSAPNTFIPLDARSISSKQKLESVFQINPAIQYLIEDVGDLRQMVEKIYFADFLLYLSRNPKTRTAEETRAVVQEQERVIGPNLQSLNTTYNVPVLEWVMDYVLFEDPYLEPPPESMQGQSLKPEFISVFAQAQKAADLPAVDQFTSMVTQVGQINPQVWDKINLDKLCDIYEDRLYLPAGLNNPQDKVEAKREQAQAAAEREKALQETVPAVAKAAKDISSIQQ